jgi:hypothetical protein
VNAERRSPPANLKCVAPGLYEDDQGGLHLVLAELLEDAGWAATDENLRVMEETARELLGKEYPGVPIETYLS